uniref:Uncharacterized protein n=1 Tax=Rhizophora mucronata TaxID=61149 RepID=A0A2P2M813_RHIMU
MRNSHLNSKNAKTYTSLHNYNSLEPKNCRLSLSFSLPHDGRPVPSWMRG